MAKIPGEVVFTPPKPKPIAQPNLNPGVGPQNVGLPTYRPGDVNNPNGQLAPGPTGVPAPLQQPAAAAAAPAPVDYMALALQDPQYTQGVADIQRHNSDTLADMLKGYLRQSQGYQDNANARGALFSGAAVNAQRSAAQDYADQQARQAANVLSDTKNTQFSVFNRLIQQLGGQ